MQKSMWRVHLSVGGPYEDLWEFFLRGIKCPGQKKNVLFPQLYVQDRMSYFLIKNEPPVTLLHINLQIYIFGLTERRKNVLGLSRIIIDY